MIIFLSACGTIVIPSATPTLQPPAVLPDLVISNVYLGMQGVPGGWTNCVPNYGPFEIRVMIQNTGVGPAYSVSVVELNSGASQMINELGAGQGLELYFPVMAFNGAYNFGADPQNVIAESNEGNNVFSYIAPTPTPPALCPTTVPATVEFPTPVPTLPATSSSAGTDLPMAALLNGVYYSPDWGQFQLTDGVYYRTPPTAQESPETYTTRIMEPVFYGDVNMDGLQDALVILNTQNGGTGHFIELAVVLNQNGSANNVSTVSLGDRVGVEAATVENGVITLSMRVHGPDDGLCCASQAATWRFLLVENQLVKLP
jgi:hypothetical protein